MRHRIYFTVRAFLYLFFFAVAFAYFSNSIGNPFTFQTRFHIEPATLLLLFLLLFLFFRLKYKVVFHRIFSRILLPVLSILIISSVVLSLLNYFIHENYVFSISRINVDQLSYLTILLGLTSLLNISNEFYKKHYRKLIFVAPLVILSVGLVIRMWPFDVFFQIIKEDELVEYSQFFALAVASVASALIIRNVYVKKRYLLSVIFVFITVGLILVAGDEIS